MVAVVAVVAAEATLVAPGVVVAGATLLAPAGVGEEATLAAAAAGAARSQRSEVAGIDSLRDQVPG